MTSYNRLSLSLLVFPRVYKMRRTANIYAESSDKLIELSHVKSVLYNEAHLVYKDV